MNYEEKLSKLREEICEKCGCSEEDCFSCEINRILFDLDRLAEKETPKKPQKRDIGKLVFKNGNMTQPIYFECCPNCKTTLETMTTRCSECGQVLEWGEEE